MVLTEEPPLLPPHTPRQRRRRCQHPCHPQSRREGEQEAVLGCGCCVCVCGGSERRQGGGGTEWVLVGEPGKGREAGRQAGGPHPSLLTWLVQRPRCVLCVRLDGRRGGPDGSSPIEVRNASVGDGAGSPAVVGGRPFFQDVPVTHTWDGLRRKGNGSGRSMTVSNEWPARPTGRQRGCFCFACQPRGLLRSSTDREEAMKAI